MRTTTLADDADDVTRYIKELLEEANIYELRDACFLMGEGEWTSKGVEEQHGSLACVHRFHPDLSSVTVAMRAFLHQGRALS